MKVNRVLRIAFVVLVALPLLGCFTINACQWGLATGGGDVNQIQQGDTTTTTDADAMMFFVVICILCVLLLLFVAASATGMGPGV